MGTEEILKFCMKNGMLLDREVLDIFGSDDSESAKFILETVKNLKDKDFDYLIEIAKDKKFSAVLEKRDELSKKDWLKLADIRLLRFIPKIF